MRFKILRDFNLAMLAKQAWRFHTSPNSLISRCFKEKYYPHTDILQASTGPNPSYARRSIYNAIWIIQKGTCWRIGSGQNVKIWEDHWIPYHNNFKVITIDRGDSNMRLVKDLMNPDGQGWNSEVLEGNFLHIDSSAITQIPIIESTNMDALMWMFEPNGCYTVKSGYKAIQIWKARSQTTARTSNENNSVWKKLWNLNTIPRHKTIIWRILTNSLPLRSELGKRGILCIPLCPRCESKVETLNHTFSSSPFISRTWFGSNVNLKILDIPMFDFQEWLTHSLLNVKEEIIIQIASIIYNIWQAHDQSIYENQNLPEEEIFQRTSRCINDFLLANSTDSETETHYSKHPSIPHIPTSPPVSAGS